MGMRRNWLTGEWEEFESPADGREIIAREELPPGRDVQRCGNAWSKPWVSEALSVHPKQVAEFNEAAKRNNTGAFYRQDGKLVCESRGARARECRARGVFDKQGGYGDYTGR
jgi:hypothetical protein